MLEATTVSPHTKMAYPAQDDVTNEYERQRLARIAAATPNAIPNEPVPTMTGGAASRIPNSNGEYIIGASSGSSAAVLNRPRSEWGTPAQTTSVGQVPLDAGERNALGFNVANTVQGAPLSPQENQFWATNPAGAVLNPQGGLTGFGTGNRTQTSGRLIPPDVFGTPSDDNQPTRPDYGQAINDYYTQRRQAIQDAKAPLMVHLGMADPSTIGASATTLLSKQGGRRSEYEQGLRQLRDLNAQENQIINEHKAAVIEHARTMHENVANQAHIDAATGITKLSTGLNYVNQTYQKGTPQYQSAITELLQDPQIAQAVTTKGGQSILAPHLKAHEDTSAVAQRLQDAGYAVTPRSVGTTGGVSYSVKSSGAQEKIPEAALLSHGRLLDLVAAHEQASQKEAATNTVAGKVNVPYSQSARLQANRQAISDLEQRYPGLTAPQQTPIPATTPQQSTANSLQIKSDEEFNQLPSGSIFVDPNGVRRRKP